MSYANGNGNGRRVDYDAIVVGGGHNGLTAAAYLARPTATAAAPGAARTPRTPRAGSWPRSMGSGCM